MKKMILALTVAALVSPAFAADQEHKEDVKVDHSKNPITGTETTTKTTKLKKKGEHAKADVTIKEKTKTHKDGKVETSTKVDGDTSAETH